MSRTAKVVAEFAGDEHDFCLRWGEIVELQEARDAGPAWLLTRMIGGQWLVQDVSEIIRLGLVGGGMDAKAARKLVRTNVEQRPLDLGGEDGLFMLAVKILSAAIHGAEDEPGKPEGRANGSTTSPEARSGSPPSSAAPS